MGMLPGRWNEGYDFTQFQIISTISSILTLHFSHSVHSIFFAVNLIIDEQLLVLGSTQLGIAIAQVGRGEVSFQFSRSTLSTMARESPSPGGRCHVALDFEIRNQLINQSIKNSINPIEPD
jgi:hypothetical protein